MPDLVRDGLDALLHRAEAHQQRVLGESVGVRLLKVGHLLPDRAHLVLVGVRVCEGFAFRNPVVARALGGARRKLDEPFGVFDTVTGQQHFVQPSEHRGRRRVKVRKVSLLAHLLAVERPDVPGVLANVERVAHLVVLQL